MGITRTASLPRLSSPSSEDQVIYKEKIANGISAVINNKGLSRVEKLRAHGKEEFFKGSYQEALNDFNAAIALKQDDHGLYGLRCNAYSKLGDFEKAVDDCNKMIELRPQDYKGHYLKGNALFHSQSMGKALLAYREAFELARDDSIKKQIQIAIEKIENIKRIRDIRTNSSKLHREQSEVFIVVRDSDGQLLHKTIVYKRQQSPSHLYKEWKAATKIQCNWRGHMIRKWIEATLADARKIIRINAENKRRAKAALKIQAFVRGHQTRTQMKPQLAEWKREKLMQQEREKAFLKLLQTGIIPEIKQIRQESERVDEVIKEEQKSIARQIGDIDDIISQKNTTRIFELEKGIDVIKEREEQKVQELKQILEEEIAKRVARDNRNYIKEKEAHTTRITLRNSKDLPKVSSIAKAYRAQIIVDKKQPRASSP